VKTRVANPHFHEQVDGTLYHGDAFTEFFGKPDELIKKQRRQHLDVKVMPLAGILPGDTNAIIEEKLNDAWLKVIRDFESFANDWASNRLSPDQLRKAIILISMGKRTPQEYGIDSDSIPYFDIYKMKPMLKPLKRVAVASSIAKRLFVAASIEPLPVQKKVFEELVELLSEDGLHVVNKKSPRHLDVNGYARSIKRKVSKLGNKYRGSYDFKVTPGEFKKLLHVTIIPSVNKEFSAEFKDGVAYFTSGAMKGQQVCWSNRAGRELPEIIENSRIKIKPDVWNGTLYGWQVVK